MAVVVFGEGGAVLKLLVAVVLAPDATLDEVLDGWARGSRRAVRIVEDDGATRTLIELPERRGPAHVPYDVYPHLSCAVGASPVGMAIAEALEPCDAVIVVGRAGVDRMRGVGEALAVVSAILAERLSERPVFFHCLPGADDVSVAGFTDAVMAMWAVAARPRWIRRFLGRGPALLLPPQLAVGVTSANDPLLDHVVQAALVTPRVRRYLASISGGAV